VIVEACTVALRAAGVAYIVGGVFAGFCATSPLTSKGSTAASTGAVAIDGDRQSWRIVSALLFIAVGAASIWGREAAAALLGALVVQQGVYIMRQTMAAKSIARNAQARSAAPSLNTKVVFAVTAVLAAASAWLDAVGALH
jgi:hypothetical protein